MAIFTQDIPDIILILDTFIFKWEFETLLYVILFSFKSKVNT